jgi:hypothetical protein
MSMFLSFVTGGALKIIAGLISGYIRLQREEKLILLKADVDRMRILYGGDLKPEPFRDWTRRFLAIMITSTLCGIVTYLMIFRPDQVFSIAVPKSPGWLLSFFFGSVDKGVLTISAGSLLWEFVNFVSLIAGFYFTKILNEK